MSIFMLETRDHDDDGYAEYELDQDAGYFLTREAAEAKIAEYQAAQREEYANYVRATEKQNAGRLHDYEESERKARVLREAGFAPEHVVAVENRWFHEVETFERWSRGESSWTVEEIKAGSVG